MKKYMAISRMIFKALLSWRFDVLWNMVSVFARILFAVVVWGVVFAQQDRVGGFTLEAMLTYYVVSALLSQLEGAHASTDEVAGRIREGTFTKYMVVPVDAEGYFLALGLGAKLLLGAFLLLAAGVCVGLFGIPLTLAGDPVTLLGAGVMALLGLLFSAQLQFFIGILAFKLENVWLLNMIKNNLAAFVTGAIVPLALLPQALLGIMRLFPFYYVTYLPAMLFMGQAREELWQGLLILLAWMVAFYALNRVTYQALRRRYEGVGI